MDTTAVLKIVLAISLTVWALRVVLSGAPFLPTHREHIKTILERVNDDAGLRMADIGAGDGRIVCAFAKRDIEAHGFEHNPILVLLARWRIRHAGLEDRAHMQRKNFWRTDFSSFSIVTVFGITRIMPKLGEKLRREMKPGSRVFSVLFPFPDWKPEWTNGAVHEYRIPE